MYQVKIYDGPYDSNGIEIHSPGVSEIKVIGESLRLGINAVSGFRFTLFPNNPGWLKLHTKRTIVKVFDTVKNECVFEGRVLSPVGQMQSDGVVGITYQCGCLLGYLQDSIQSWEDIRNMTPRNFLQHLINVHNSQVESHKRFNLGVVSISNGPTQVHYFVDDESTTYEMIKDRLINRIGGELRVRNVNGQLYLDWMDVIGEVVDTTIQVTKNMISISSENDSLSTITRLFPRGARLEADTADGEPNPVSTPRLTIASVNNGREFIDANQDLIDAFGIVSGAVTWDDVTLPENLLRNARGWLSDQKASVMRVSMSAIDLGLIGIDSDHFRVGNAYRCINKLINLDQYLRIVEIQLDINRPERSTLSLGSKPLALSQQQASLAKSQKRLGGVENAVVTQSRRIASVAQTATLIRQDVAELQSTIGEADFDKIAELRANVATLTTDLAEHIASTGNVQQQQQRFNDRIVARVDDTVRTQQSINNDIADEINDLKQDQQQFNDHIVAKIDDAVAQQQTLNAEILSRLEALEDYENEEEDDVDDK